MPKHKENEMSDAYREALTVIETMTEEELDAVIAWMEAHLQGASIH